MQELSSSFDENIDTLDGILNVKDNFDIIKREMEINSQRVVMYYIDGFVTAQIIERSC